MKYPIDLSMLTKEETEQFKENKEVLTKGDADVVLYMRFSSDRQSEQSIEGQLRDALAFCKLRKYRIVGIYVDRATTARKNIEKRTDFLRMIQDSDKKSFQYVLVWKLDRFARNRNDSAFYRMRLNRNGVKVISITENISESPEGIILESILEGMAEYYSADLSVKIKRGMRESALKCQSTGGHIPLGYAIENHRFVVDPKEAKIVKKAFQLYADGWTIADICREFNRLGYKTTKGVDFNRSSFKSMFHNKRYIGVYKYNGMEIEDGVPAIIDKELFEKVSMKLKDNKDAPGKSRAKTEYLLTGKIFCGHCGSQMVGDSGTSKSGTLHTYYTCFERKKHKNCNKKSIQKDLIETWVVQDAMELFSQELIEEIADIAVKQSEKEIAQQTNLPALRQKQKEIDKSIKHIVDVIERGLESESLIGRLSDLEKEKKQIAREIAEEEKYVVKLDKPQIIYWLSKFKEGSIEDDKFKRQIIDLLINSVTVFDLPDGDFKITTAYNLTSCPEKTFKLSERCSDITDNAPPFAAYPNTLIIGGICIQEKRHSA